MSRLALLAALLLLALPARAAELRLVERALLPPVERAGSGGDGSLGDLAWKIAAIDGIASLIVGETLTAVIIGRQREVSSATEFLVAGGLVPLVTVGLPWGATVLLNGNDPAGRELGWNLFAEAALWSVAVRVALAGLGVWRGEKGWFYAAAAAGAIVEGVSVYRGADAL